MALNFEILGAAWGTADVTKKVWSLVNKDGLKVKADNATFGPDPMRGYLKALVVWYRYPGAKPRLLTAVENTTMKIEVLPKHQEEQATMLSADWQAIISNTSSRNPCNRKSITILGAAWGIEDVTEVARSSLLNGNTRFEKLATNEALGKDCWHSVLKVRVLVVVYQYSDIPMMSIVKEKETMCFMISPPLFILGAAYGHEVVTNEVQSLVKQHQLTLTPANDLSKPTLLNFKSLVMVYQFGSEQPQLFIGDQSGVCIRYESQTMKEDEDVVVDPSQLVILGAAYGLRDVTRKVQLTVLNKHELEITNINDTTMDTLADAWRWYNKTLVVIYRYGTGPPMVTIKKTGEKIEIQKELPPIYGGLIDSKHLVSNSDTISLIALNNKYVAVDPDSGKLIANTEGSGCEFEIVLPSSNGPFFLQDKQSRKYCAVDDKGYLILKGNHGKTSFLLSLSISGKVQLATNDKKFIRLADNQFLKADSSEHFSASTSFQLQVDCSATKNVSKLAPSNETTFSNKKSWLFFVWQTFEGFFLALGLEPFLNQFEPSADLLHLLSSELKTSLTTLRDELRSTTSETAAIRSAVRFIRNVWKEGVLWKTFKFLRLQEGVIIYTEIFTRIAQAVLIKETDACLLLAGLTTWATQLIEVSKKLEDLYIE